MYKNRFGPDPSINLAATAEPTDLPHFVVIGGPCSIESQEQVEAIYSAIDDSVTHFRGGVFRAGTYPSQTMWGWKMDLLKMTHEQAKARGKPNIVDVLDLRDLDMIEPYADAFQVGMRQSQHYALLKELGRQSKPVILKRGTWQTLGEFLGSLEYILQGGNNNVILAERGSVSHLDHVRWEISISMIAVLKEITKMRVVVDASHGTGKSSIVRNIALAGVAAGADGVLLETHSYPEKSLSDAEQAIDLATFNEVVETARRIRRLAWEPALV